jgi:hypothetical protein
MMMIIIDLRETGYVRMDFIDLTQDRDQWRALVNTAMNLRNDWLSGLCSSSGIVNTRKKATFGKPNLDQ